MNLVFTTISFFMNLNFRVLFSTVRKSHWSHRKDLILSFSCTFIWVFSLSFRISLKLHWLVLLINFYVAIQTFLFNSSKLALVTFQYFLVFLIMYKFYMVVQCPFFSVTISQEGHFKTSMISDEFSKYKSLISTPWIYL